MIGFLVLIVLLLLTWLGTLVYVMNTNKTINWVIPIWITVCIEIEITIEKTRISIFYI